MVEFDIIGYFNINCYVMERNMTVIDVQHLSKIIDAILVFAGRGKGYARICRRPSFD